MVPGLSLYSLQKYFETVSSGGQTTVAFTSNKSDDKEQPAIRVNSWSTILKSATKCKTVLMCAMLYTLFPMTIDAKKQEYKIYSCLLKTS